ncbi:MAG: class I SAM-dependent methyltransferase [Flavobacteriales bacterium]|nr:class I SAM-dependent methyltransferase [Flavobacteriales bacterium]
MGIGTVMLYYTFGFEHLEGVDRNSEEGAVEAHIKIREEAKGEAWPYPRTLHYLWSEVEPVPSCAIAVKQTYSALREKIQLRYGCHIQNYVSLQPHYDLVIASNVLHFLPITQLREAWSRIQAWSKPGGLVYVRVKPERKEVTDTEQFIRICDEAAEKLGLKRYDGKPTGEGSHITYSNLIAAELL